MRRIEPLLKEPGFWLIVFGIVTNLYVWATR